MLLLAGGLAIVVFFTLIWAISSELNQIRLSINSLTYAVKELSDSLNRSLG